MFDDICKLYLIIIYIGGICLMKVTIEKKWNIVLVCACVVIFLPHIFNIYYSMPANDDFALSLNWWGKGIIGEAFMRA